MTSALKRSAQISNDKSGSRSYGAANEVGARTIKPKVKNFDKDVRATLTVGVHRTNLRLLLQADRVEASLHPAAGAHD